MKKLICIAAVAAALVNLGYAHASERSVARLVGVTGNVLVTNDHNIASAGEALRLLPGMRVLVTLNSSATVEYDDGCRVNVRSGERFEVRGDRPCTARATPVVTLYAPVIKGRP
jgi:hypothetical protein